MNKLPKNIQRIQNWLDKIDWKLHHHGCGHYVIYDHLERPTNWTVYGDTDTRIYNDETEFKGSCVFYLRDVRFGVLKHGATKIADCVTIKPKYAPKNPGIFLQFYNHDRSKAKSVAE